jgi:uncharacterized protein YuzE
MKVKYDAKTDTMAVGFSPAPIAESDETKPGVILDYDAADNLVGLELLDASKCVTEVQRTEFDVAD